MANTIKQKRGTSNPEASNLVVGELAINTTDGGVFTKTDGGSVVEVGGSGGASAINDLSDAVTYDSGLSVGLGTGALTSDDGSNNNNTALGYNAGNSISSAADNVLIGYRAGEERDTIGGATCIGAEAGLNIKGYHTTAIGYQALKGSGTGFGSGDLNNTAIGYQAGRDVTATSQRNTFLGYASGRAVTNGSSNVFIGALSADHVEAGSGNVVIGQDCASGGGTYANRLTSGDNNIIIGNLADASSSTVDNEITLGNTSITAFRIPGINLEASAGVLNVKNGGNQSEVRWYCESSNAHYAAIKAPPHSGFSGNITFTMPGTAGSSGQVLKTDGAGNLSWVDQASGGGSTSPAGSNTQVQFNDSGNFGGSSSLTFNGTNLTCGGKVSAGASAASNANDLRKITTSTSNPSGGSDGDIWIKYTA